MMTPISGPPTNFERPSPSPCYFWDFHLLLTLLTLLNFLAPEPGVAALIPPGNTFFLKVPGRWREGVLRGVLFFVVRMVLDNP